MPLFILITFRENEFVGRLVEKLNCMLLTNLVKVLVNWLIKSQAVTTYLDDSKSEIQ